MSGTGFRPFASIILAVFAILMLSGTAIAQSQNEIRRENQRLRTQAADLERELEAARSEIEVLKTRIAELEDRLAERGSPASNATKPLEPEEVTIDESEPHASPRALLKAIQDDYQEATKDLETGDGRNSVARGLYLKKLERWSVKINRQFKKPIEWHVRLVDGDEQLTSGAREIVMHLEAVDPVTDVTLGDGLDAALSGCSAMHLERRLDREGRNGVLILKGVLHPLVRINRDRERIDSFGPFDNPRFIGPFAEFEFEVQVQTVLPKPKEKPETPSEG